LNPSIQNPAQISTVALTFSGPELSIVVSDTAYFPDEGYLFHKSNNYSGVIKYTGRSPSTFTGCTIYTGDNQIEIGSEIVPFTI